MEVRARRGQEKAEDRVVPCLCGREEGKECRKLCLPKLKILITAVGLLLARKRPGNMYWHAPSSIFIRPYLLNVFPSTPLSPSIQRDNYDGTH